MHAACFTLQKSDPRNSGDARQTLASLDATTAGTSGDSNDSKCCLQYIGSWFEKHDQFKMSLHLYRFRGQYRFSAFS